MHSVFYDIITYNQEMHVSKTPLTYQRNSGGNAMFAFSRLVLSERSKRFVGGWRFTQIT